MVVLQEWGPLGCVPPLWTAPPVMPHSLVSIRKWGFMVRLEGVADRVRHLPAGKQDGLSVQPLSWTLSSVTHQIGDSLM